MPSARAALPVGLALLLAGCLAVPEPETGSGGQAAPPASPFAALPRFELAGKDCAWAGFVAAYPMAERGYPDTLADVWVLADIREEIGNPTRDATGFPVAGPLMGNWHMGLRCAAVETSAGAEEEFIFGFVGDVVAPPAWDAGGADLHFLLSGLSFANGTIGDAMRDSTTADVTHTARVDIRWLTPKDLPRASASVEFLDAEKGLYESVSTLSLYRETPARTLRLWWQVPADGSKNDHAHHHDSGGSLTSFGTQEPTEGEYHPVFWDLQLASGFHYATPPADGVELASHNRFSFEHGPIAAQPCVTMIQEVSELTFRSGLVVDDVLLAKLWTH